MPVAEEEEPVSDTMGGPAGKKDSCIDAKLLKAKLTLFFTF